MNDDRTPTAVVVGAGFAGIGAARELAKHGVRVVLVERNDYHQFQPLLYQVATAGLARSDVASSLRTLMRHHDLVDVKAAEVATIDPVARSVTAVDGTTFTGDYLILAAGSRPNFFDTAGADEHSIPLYSVNDAERLPTRVFAAFDAADRDPSLVNRGVIRFVVVGGGPTGVEVAGALAELIQDVLPHQYRGLAVRSASVHLVDHAHTLLGPFSDRAHDYAAKVLQRKGVRLHRRGRPGRGGRRSRRPGRDRRGHADFRRPRARGRRPPAPAGCHPGAVAPSTHERGTPWPTSSRRQRHCPSPSTA